MSASSPHRNDDFGFGVFLGGQSVSLLGDGLALVAIPLLTLELTDDPVLAAVAAGPRYVAYIVMGLPAGALVERWQPRSVMLATDGIRVGVFLILGTLIWVGHPSAYVPLGLALVAAVAGVFFETALNVAIRDVAEERGGPSSPLVVRASAFLELAAQAAIVVGPALGGVLAATVGIRVALMVNAATFVVSGLTVFATRLPATVRGAARPIRTEVAVGLRYLVRDPLIRIVTIMQAFANLLIAVESLIIFTVHEVLHAGSLATGAVVSASGAGGVLGAVWAVYLVRVHGEWRVFVVCLAMVGGALAAIGVGHSVWWVAGANLVIGAAIAAAIVAARVLRLRVVPRAYLARVTASTKMFALAPQPVGVVLAGVMTGLLGGDPRPVFLGSGVLTMLLAVTAAWLPTSKPSDQDVRSWGALEV